MKKDDTKHYDILLTRQARKDAHQIERSGLLKKALVLIDILIEDPFANPPTYEKLQPPTAHMYSRRINKQHRLVYTVDEAKLIVKILRMWTHYE
jgi:Txe/YoeB family toxin of toxin-antitoxin system